MKKCPFCGEEIQDDAIKCRYCGEWLQETPPPPHGSGNGFRFGNTGDEFYDSPDYERCRNNGWMNNDAFATGPFGKSRGVCAILAILLGSLGIHYFYLGKNTGGIVYLILTVLSCGTVPAILGIIQGAMMFGMTNSEFEKRYVTSVSSFPF